MKLRQGILKVKRGTTWIKLKGGENPQCLDFRHNIILISVVVLASFGFEVDLAYRKIKGETSAFVPGGSVHVGSEPHRLSSP